MNDVKERTWPLEAASAGEKSDSRVEVGHRHETRAFLRLVRGPFTAARLLADRVIVPLWLRWRGVHIDADCVFVGCPVLRLETGAHIALGRGVQILSRADSNPAGLPHPTMIAAGPHSRIVIGEQTGISGASIVARAGITIGRQVLIGAGACIWDTDFHPLHPEQRRMHQTRHARSAPIMIEDEVFIGARAIILKGVRIGRGAVVGAGSVVRRDVEAFTVVAGNPATTIGTLHPPERQHTLLR